MPTADLVNDDNHKDIEGISVGEGEDGPYFCASRELASDPLPPMLCRPLLCLRCLSIPDWNSGSLSVRGVQRTPGPKFLNSTQHLSW